MPDTTVKKVTRNIGCRDIYIAEVTEDTESKYTAGAPVKLARAMSIKITDKFNTENLYSDDSLEDIAEGYAETDVEMKINTMSQADYANLYNVLNSNGFLVKSAEDTAKKIALGWRSKRLDGTYDFFWLYVGKLTERPELEYATIEDKPSPKEQTLKGTFSSRQKADTVDGKEKHFYQIQVNECELVSANTDAKTAITDWFSKVQEYKQTTP